jgi:hypothetical protein
LGDLFRALPAVGREDDLRALDDDVGCALSVH